VDYWLEILQGMTLGFLGKNDAFRLKAWRFKNKNKNENRIKKENVTMLQ